MEERCPASICEVAYSTQVVVHRGVAIPDCKPPLESIIKLHYKFLITRLVTVPVNLSCGSTTGCKVLVCGEVRLGIEYAAAEPEQGVYFVSSAIPFQGLILGGPDHRPVPLKECNLRKFELHICVEYLEVHPVDHRTLEAVIMLLIWMERRGGAVGKNIPPTPTVGPRPDISKEITVNHPLFIPCEKPPVRCILDCDAEVEVLKVMVIDTGLVSSDSLLPLRKALLTGKVRVKIEYVADISSQRVHAAYFLEPFEAALEWPGGPPSADRVRACVSVEHFQLDLLEPKCLQKTLVIRIDLYRFSP